MSTICTGSIWDSFVLCCGNDGSVASAMTTTTIITTNDTASNNAMETAMGVTLVPWL